MRPKSIFVLALVPLILGILSVMPMSAVASEGKPFEIKSFSLQMTAATRETSITNGEGSEFVNEPYAFTQAGGHPWGLTTTGELASEELHTPEGSDVVPTQDPKDIVVGLPAGLLGNPMAVPRCALAQVTSGGGLCPADTQVGVYRLRDFGGGKEYLAPIVNVAPSAGQSAEFALENTVPVDVPLLTAHLVRTAQGTYGFTVVSGSIPLVGIVHFELTFWGVPADPSHDPMRGRVCRKAGADDLLVCEGGNIAAGISPVPFLSLPTDCSGGPEVATIRADSWENPGSVSEGRYTGFSEKTATLPPVTGCGLLSFDPTLEVQPETQLADSPVGLGVNIKVPQPESPGLAATPHLRNAVVTLPEGMSVSPGVVDGIRACEEAGPEGINFEGPESEEVGPSGELQLAAGHCPAASTVGTAEAITPLLPEPVRGHVYLARPRCGAAGQHDCTSEDAANGDLYQLYLELGGTGELASTGINIKVRGKVEANPATGQLTTVFEENPQAPFSELKIHLNGGPRASLDSPAVCGLATTTARFTPWSAPGISPEGLLLPGTPDATPSSFYEVQGCSGATGLQPGFSAGTVSPQAGKFSPFTLHLSREDREQYIKGIQVQTPPGLLGMLANVPLCGEPAADLGTCPESSKIGTTRVASGAGSHPFEIGGNVYLTGGYEGAPFGLSIVTDAVAGPFNLGLVVVRARIDVDPATSALTITTDETGPYAVPQILDGVPLRLKGITVNIDRPAFMFNPTNCAAQQITAAISGSANATTTVSEPFAAAGCSTLAFKPKFAVSTSAHTSRGTGASLDAKLSYPAGAVGSEANVARVKVELPKILPSQLKTLQKACPAATFDANPSGCPTASTVGVARATTPVLPVPLSGPVYFVSHGGEEFPSLIVVLQGDGVRVDLTGSTHISANGITSSTFKTVPDVPVGTFELYLPEGRYSALAANGNLCKSASKLVMPTELVAQNGAVIRQRTKIAVVGCPAHKDRRARTRAQTTKNRRSR